MEGYFLIDQSDLVRTYVHARRQFYDLPKVIAVVRRTDKYGWRFKIGAGPWISVDADNIADIKPVVLTAVNLL